LRICSASPDVTISHLGRELGITRQGASKLVAGLRDRRYVVLCDSQTDGREKIVMLTRRGSDLLAAQRTAAHTIEGRLRSDIGSESFDGLYRLLQVLGGDSQPRLADYLGAVREPDAP
jgi:DNA-binding MarR family transcriptional regulator